MFNVRGAAALSDAEVENLARERAFFAETRAATFERPYGWGWLLRLEAELVSWDDPMARELAAHVRPLADLLAARLLDYLDRLSLPIRVGDSSLIDVGDQIGSMFGFLDPNGAGQVSGLEGHVVVLAYFALF